MTAIIVSDLHIGSTCFDAEKFLRFLKNGPAYNTLILNGDTAQNRGEGIPDGHAKVLDTLSDISADKHVVWVAGNHDRGYQSPRPASIEFRESFNIGSQLVVFHGDKMIPLRGLLRVMSIAIRPIVAHMDEEHMSVRLAKAIPFFYRYLARRLMVNATAYAAREGYSAVACGHVHGTADRMCGGIRYINTGTWTDSTGPYLLVEGEEMTLSSFE